jgi:hypothetical protein
VSIAALESAYLFLTQTDLLASGALGALDLARTDSLAGWLVTLALFAAAVLSFFIYSVRRYRLDDYRGRYRVWMWAGALWLLMGIDAAVNLREAIQAACIALSDRIGPLDGKAWWLGPWSLLVGWLGVRMVLDMRGCRTAIASLIIGLGLLPVGLVLRQVQLPLAARELVMITAGCWLTACWLLLFGHVAYARHVLFDAHGRLPVRAPKARREKKAKALAAGAPADSSKATAGGVKRRDDLTTRIDPPHGSSYRPATGGIDLGKAAKQSNLQAQGSAAKMTIGASNNAATAKAASAPAKVTQFINGREEDDDSRPSNKLSRAERKRLRKQQRAGSYDDE